MEEYETYEEVENEEDFDFSSMSELSDYLDKQNIKHVIIRDYFDVKSLRAADKKDLLEYIKKRNRPGRIRTENVFKR